MTPRVSPDETKVAVTQVDPISGNFDIWVYLNPAERPRRLTSSPAVDYYPLWALDGKSVYYSAEHLSYTAIFQVPVDGSAPPKLVFASPNGNVFPTDISPDGKFLFASTVSSTDPGILWRVPFDGGAPQPLISTPASEHHGSVSKGPHAGRWFAYSSNETGTWQVYVRRLTDKGLLDTKSQISTVRGMYPKWKPDGSAIYFVGPNNQMMSASIRITGELIDIGQPRVLFDSKFMPVPTVRYSYDISPRSGRLLLMTPQPAKRAAGLDLIMNWTLLLNRPTQ